MDRIGEKFISGKIVSLDSEKLEELEKMSKELKNEESTIKKKIDTIIK